METGLKSIRVVCQKQHSVISFELDAPAYLIEKRVKLRGVEMMDLLENIQFLLTKNFLPLAIIMRYLLAYEKFVVHRLNVDTASARAYDARFSNFYLGMFTINNAIRGFFDDGTVSNIDFVTDMPFMEAWASHCQNRKEVSMRMGFLVRKMLSFYTNEHVRKKISPILDTSLGKLAVRAHSLWNH